MVTLLEAYRAMLMEGVFPSALMLLAWAVVGALVLLLGVRLFRRMSVHFAEEL